MTISVTTVHCVACHSLGGESEDSPELFIVAPRQKKEGSTPVLKVVPLEGLCWISLVSKVVLIP